MGRTLPKIVKAFFFMLFNMFTWNQLCMYNAFDGSSQKSKLDLYSFSKLLWFRDLTDQNPEGVSHMMCIKFSQSFSTWWLTPPILHQVFKIRVIYNQSSHLQYVLILWKLHDTCYTVVPLTGSFAVGSHFSYVRSRGHWQSEEWVATFYRLQLIARASTGIWWLKTSESIVCYCVWHVSRFHHLALLLYPQRASV